MYRGWTQTDYQNKHYNINQKWLQHVQRMDTNRLPKQALQYKPKVATTCTEDGHKQTTKRTLQYKPNGRRNIGRPRKRWRDQLHLEDQGTGNTPYPSGTWWWWWWWWWRLFFEKLNLATNSEEPLCCKLVGTRSFWLISAVWHSQSSLKIWLETDWNVRKKNTESN